MSDGVVKIHGKEYKTVAKRVADFRDKFPNHTLITELVSADDERVVMVSKVYDVDNRLVSTGWAEERRDASRLHGTSSLEICETSACGRAVAFLHRDLMGTEIASADEVANAISQQNDGEFLEFMATVRANFDWVMYAKEAIANEDWQSLAGIWGDIDHETMATLFRAPTKGGIFTTEERAACKGNDAFNQARKELANGV
ncbi:MAG: hypothetical protein VXB01_06875 [Opitutae bacterium]|jgi:hypothetical protein